MEIIEEKKITNETPTDVSPINDDPNTILKPSLEESVIVTTTLVETTVVPTIQQEKERNESTENEKEGCFGKLVGEDEGLKVNCSENGNSVDMDVDGSLTVENGSYENPVSEEKSGHLAVKHNENVSGDPMEICLSGENEKNGDKVAEIIESKDDMTKIVTNVKNGEGDANELVDQDDEEEEDHSFVVGDFVWGKIKSHPWWPGRVYDPNDASDYAATLKHNKGQLLVAYFGDGSFSWCSPSQLKPFIDHFQEMSSQSNSKKFVNAVENVLEDVSRLVEAELTCKCQLVNLKENENAGVVNRGIKEEARVPKGNTIKVLMDRLDPVELVSVLKGYATMESGTRRVDLELVLLKSFLSAFYTKKGGYLLVDYHDPMCIEGLEEETRSGVVADSDIISPSGSPDNGDDKLYQKRKQKSVAELLGEDETNIKKAKTSKDGGMKVKKRKPLVVSVTPESDHEESGGGGGVEEETMSPRQRKKSRFLSPPYLSPIGVGSGKLSVFGSGSFKEPKTESEKVPEESGTQIEDSLKKSSGKKTRRAREGSDSQGQKKKTEADLNVTIVFNGLVRAALDPTSFMDKNLPDITEFVSSFRGSVFQEGTRKQTDIKKDSEGDDTSELGFIKQKLEWMSEMVHTCQETEMNADVKASLEGGIQQVLEKVVKLRRK